MAKELKILNEQLQLLSETFESQKEIETIAKSVIDKATIQITRRYRSVENITTNGTILFHGVEFKDITYNGPLKDFVKQLREVQFAKVTTKETLGGYNGAGSIILKYNTEEMENTKSIHKLLLLRYDTAVHELTHAYDDYQSKGKAFTKKSSDTLKDKDGYKEYLKLQHEINARFAQALVDPKVVEQKMYPSKGHKSYGGFQNYLDEIKMKLRNWFELDTKQQKHITKRAYDSYTKLTKDEENVLIANQLTKIFWNFAQDERNTFTIRDEKRIKPNLKKESTNILNQLITTKLSFNILKQDYAGVFNALTAIAEDKNQKAINQIAKNLNISVEQITDLINKF